jgi:hypothetical protein
MDKTVEGFNRKAKSTMRRVYSARNPEAPQTVLYPTLGKLPELKLNREYCRRTEKNNLYEHQLSIKNRGTAYPLTPPAKNVLRGTHPA